MRLIRSEDLARQAPRRWETQYRDKTYTDQQERTKILLALPVAERTPERIEEIIGNDTWTTVTCRECAQSVRKAIEIQDPYESGGAVHMCHDCLFAALALIEGR